MQGGVERTLLHAQHVLGSLVNPLGHAVTMHRPPSQRFQNQEVQSSLEQVSRAFLLILHGGSLPLSIRRLGEGNVSAWRPPRCGRHGGGVSPAPIESETLAVPGDDGFGLEDEQCRPPIVSPPGERSEEHTSELQSPYELVCRLLLEKKKKRSNSDNGIASYH